MQKKRINIIGKVSVYYQLDASTGTFAACVTDGVTIDFPNGNVVSVRNVLNNNIVDIIKLLTVSFLRVRKPSRVCKKCAKTFCK